MSTNTVKLFLKSKIVNYYVHVLNYGLGSVLPQVIGFFLIPLYIRYLTPNDYGILELASSLSAFCIGLMHLKVPGSISRYYFDYFKNPISIKNYITTVRRLVSGISIISMTLILTVLFFSQPYIFPDLDFWPYCVIVVVTAAIGANSAIQQRLLQNREQSKYYAILKTIFAFVSIGLALLFVVILNMGALGMLLSTLIVGVIFFLQADFYLNKDGKGIFDRLMAKKAVFYGLALAPAIIAGDAALLFNKGLLLKYGALQAVGIYSIANRFYLPLNILADATNRAFVPFYNKLRKEGNTSGIKVNIRGTLVINLAIYAGFMLFMPMVMRFMLTKEYYPSIRLIPFIGFTFIGKTIYHMTIAEVFYQIKVKYMALLTIGSVGVNTFICILLVNQYQEVGVCIGYTVGALSLALMSVIYKKNVSQFPMFKWEILIYLLVSCFVTILAGLIYI